MNANLISLVLVSELVAGAQVIRESRTGAIRYTWLVGRLNEAEIGAKALDLLGSRKVTLGRVVVYSSQRDSRFAAREDYLEGCSLDELHSFLKWNGLLMGVGHCPNLSEAIKIGPNIIIRTLDSRCRQSRKLLLGSSDPLSITSLGTKHEIIAVSVRQRRVQAKQVAGPKIANVFVRTNSKLSTELAKDILTGLKEATGASEIAVALRNDTNFVRHCSFPAPYLFDRAVAGNVDANRTATGGEVYCVALDPWPIQCYSYQATRADPQQERGR